VLGGQGVGSTFGSAISAPEIVTLDENTTVGTITFNNTNSYTIAPGTAGYSLTLDNAGAAANITVTTGSHTISAPLVLTSPGLNVSLGSTDALTLAGQITGSGPLALTGAGTLRFGNNIGGVSLTGLTIAAGGTLDLENNHIVLSYSGTSPLSTIRGYLASGYNGGAWNGAGIDSSSAAVNHQYAIGYADSADAGNPAGLSTDQIEIKYTLYGDTNLDGVVNSVDFGNMAANFGKSGKVWDRGDFNYDGVVNSIDFGFLASNFGKSASGADVELSLGDWAALDAFAAANGLMAEVPEPAVNGLFIGTAMGIFLHRRRAVAL
jgi:hypothetical protein